MWLTEKHVNKIKEQYPIGTRIKLNHMDDIQAVPKETVGTVEYVDDQGQLQMLWDNGRGLALIPDVDDFEIISKPKLAKEDLRILIVEPQQEPRVAIIQNTLDMMQTIVGGYIETKTLDDNTILIANEDGVMLNLEMNREIGNSIILGTFFIVGDDSSDSFVSLTDDQVEIYSNKLSEIECCKSNCHIQNM